MERKTSTMTPNLRDIAASLELTAEMWSTLERAGACACCAARLTGCREAAVYALDEQELKSHIMARFQLPPSKSDGPQETERAAVVADLLKTRPVIPVNDRSGGVGVRTTTPSQEDCCTLCLGLLQYKVPVRMTPRARSSSESHGDAARSCVVTAQQLHKKTPHEDVLETGAAEVVAPTMRTAASTAGDVSAGGTHAVRSGDPAIADSRDSSASSPTNSHAAIMTVIADTDDVSCYRHARVAEAVAECAASRGYTITSFGLTVALPACLAVRDAAFIEAIGVGRDVAPDPTSVPPCSSAASAAGIEYLPAVVSVKEALKLGLIEGLQPRLGVDGAVFDAESDFVVEVTAKAPEADAHATVLLLGVPAQSPSRRKKPPGWPGSGRWSMKRQRREEHRNPGLTVGAVKKGLAVLNDEGRARMRRWVEELGKERDHEKATPLLKSREGEDGSKRRSEDDGRELEGVLCEDEGMDVDAVDVNNWLAMDKNGSRNQLLKEESSSGANSVEHSAASSVMAASNTNAHRSGNLGVSGSSAPVPARCDIVIRRLPIHFWGRYEKLSRVVPQTPWVKGFFSVQEAVSEPFEKFSGSVEGLLHGSGREDVDVRMLGNGRPFSLELVDSLRSVDEIAARLLALEKAINTAAGRKNAGGGVAVSELRVAGPGDLPSDVQRVGEGKRKHYRCVVWVSRAVGEEELKRTICKRTELVVQQSTPVRVLHRRTLMDRPRSIFDMRVQRINDHFFVLDLTTSAGTYVKEFVHGDLGRTVPSVGSLLNCRADILQLDVTHVEDKWSTQGEVGEAEKEA